MAKSRKSKKMSQQSDMLILVGLTVLIFVLMSGKKQVSKQMVWYPADEDETKAKVLNHQYGKVEDAYTRQMATAMSYRSRNEVKGIQSAAFKIRDRLKDTFKM